MLEDLRVKPGAISHAKEHSPSHQMPEQQNLLEIICPESLKINLAGCGGRIFTKKYLEVLDLEIAKKDAGCGQMVLRPSVIWESGAGETKRGLLRDPLTDCC